MGAEWIEAAKVTASDPGIVAQFGYSVAIHGDRFVVGAVFDDAPEPDSGSVYAFERDASGAWFEAAKLTASDGGSSWNLGTYVAIWGNVIAATAPGADPDRRGATYVFERDQDGVWRETAKLVAPDGSAFTGGATVWGDTIVVGTPLEDMDFPDEGAAYVFERDAGGPGNWGPVAKLKASDGAGDDRFGSAVSLDGDRLVVGARNDSDRGNDSGSVYIFDRDAAGDWFEVAKLTASDGDSADKFGQSVAVDGDTLVVGAFGDEERGFDAGAVYVFGREEGGMWVEVRKLTASDGGPSDHLGQSVGIDGDIVVSGAEGQDDVGAGSGAAYVFERDHGRLDQWEEVAKLIASDAASGDTLGSAVAVSGRSVLAGSPNDDDGATNAGSAYVFLRIDPVLAVTGICPGPVTLALSGATPNLPVALLGAASKGSAIVPSGRCAGTEVGLPAPKILTTRRADQNGELSLVRTLGPRACGSFVQVLDGFACEVSGVEQLP